MTVNYSLECATSDFATFFKLLFRWRGGLYKLIYRELLLYLSLYYAISGIYRFGFNYELKRNFEQLSQVCNKYATFIPMTFMLGFYVSIIVGRWLQIWLAIPSTEKMACNISTFVHGNDERGKLLRRTVVRYLNAVSVLSLRHISTAVKKRFPTMQHVVNAGFLTDDEAVNITEKNPYAESTEWWKPIQWACNLLQKARTEDRIVDSYTLHQLTKEVLEYGTKAATLHGYDYVNIPLVYTQARVMIIAKNTVFPLLIALGVYFFVGLCEGRLLEDLGFHFVVVTVAVYSFFLACLLGRQYLDPAQNLAGYEYDYYIPMFTLLEFIFYIGWLKVAESLMNPLGEDDDDFEINWIIDRNLWFSFMATDQYGFVPELKKDLFWLDSRRKIPHTVASFRLKNRPFSGSATNIKINDDLARIADAAGVVDRKPSTFSLGCQDRSLRRRPYTGAQGKRYRTGSENHFNQFSRSTSHQNNFLDVPMFEVLRSHSDVEQTSFANANDKKHELNHSLLCPPPIANHFNGGLASSTAVNGLSNIEDGLNNNIGDHVGDIKQQTESFPGELCELYPLSLMTETSSTQLSSIPETSESRTNHKDHNGTVP